MAFALPVGGAAAQDALVGWVRGVGGDAPAVVRAFPLPAQRLQCRDETSGAPVSVHTDAQGRFSLPLAERAALWVEAGDRGAFVAEAASGVPLRTEPAPLATVRLGADARGAHVRIDGVAVGFVAGPQLRLPAGSIELLVECGERTWIAARRLRAGEDVELAAPAVRGPRLLGAGPMVHVVLPPWPERQFVPAADGSLALPCSPRPTAVRVVTTCAGDLAFDELWLEPGEARRLDAAAPRWRAIRVLDGGGHPVAGAQVLTVRSGPGRPAACSSSVTAADGAARWREDVDRSVVVIEAEGHAVRAVLPADLARGDGADGDDADAPEMRLERARELRLRVHGGDAQPVAGARVTARTAPDVVHVAHTDGRGGVRFGQLPTGAVQLGIDHEDHVPLALAVVLEVDVPAPQPVEVALDQGLAIAGRIVAADGVDLDDVLLEARGRAGHDALRRRVRVASDGSFVVRGLPDAPIDLFAWRIDRGVTWSGRVLAVPPGTAPVTVTIACDDPATGSR